MIKVINCKWKTILLVYCHKTMKLQIKIKDVNLQDGLLTIQLTRTPNSKRKILEIKWKWWDNVMLYLRLQVSNIFLKVYNARKCWFTHFVRFVNVKLFLFWIKYWVRHWGVQFWLLFRAISGSQLLQSTWIIKQTIILLWKICRKYGFVSYSFSCIL